MYARPKASGAFGAACRLNILSVAGKAATEAAERAINVGTLIIMSRDDQWLMAMGSCERPRYLHWVSVIYLHDSRDASGVPRGAITPERHAAVGDSHLRRRTCKANVSPICSPLQKDRLRRGVTIIPLGCRTGATYGEDTPPERKLQGRSRLGRRTAQKRLQVGSSEFANEQSASRLTCANGAFC